MVQNIVIVDAHYLVLQLSDCGRKIISSRYREESFNFTNLLTIFMSSQMSSNVVSSQ